MTSSILENLLKKHAQMEARIKDLKSRESKHKKKLEDRRKILAGAYVLEKHQREGTYESFISELDKFLIRDGDRAAFNLSPKEKANTKEYA